MDLPTPHQTETPRDLLRHATRPAHERVDALFGRLDLSDIADYRAFLAAHASVLPAVEAWLDRHQSDAGLGDWSAVRRTPALLVDCDALGIAHPSPAGFAMAGDIASVCGVTYVIEGSRLGGALLSRRVAEGLPRAYLGAPPQTALWRAFLADLDRLLPDRTAIDHAVEAACQTFEAFRIAGEDAVPA